MKYWALCAILIAGPAWGQGAVLQNGTVTPNNAMQWARDRTAQDVGGLTGRTNNGLGFNPFSITDLNTCGLQFNTASTLSTYHSLCIGHNSTGAPIFKVDGTEYPFIGGGGGSVVGPATTITDGLVTWGNTTGTLLKYAATGVRLLAGNQTGTSPWLNTLYEQTPGEISAILNGIYSHNTSSFFGISSDFSAANDPTGANVDSPRAVMTLLGTNTGSVSAMDILLGICDLRAANTKCQAGNFIAASSGTGLAGLELNALELDVQDNGANTNTYTQKAALLLNAIGVRNVTGIQTGAAGGGTVAIGMALGGMATNGVGISGIGGAANDMGVMVNCFNGSFGYNTACIQILNNGNNTGAGKGQFIGWLNHTGSVAAAIRMPTADTWLFENYAATRTTFGDGSTKYVLDLSAANDNFIAMNAAVTGNSPSIIAAGLDAVINLDLAGKGGGGVRFNSIGVANLGMEFPTGAAALAGPSITGVSNELLLTTGSTGLRIKNSDNSQTRLTLSDAGALVIPGTISLASLADSSTAPTIASGGCTTGSAQSISSNNGSAGFSITLGGATCGSTIVLTLPTAAHGWHCSADDITTPATSEIHQTSGGSATSVTLTNYVRTTGVAGNFTAADVIAVSCRGY